MEFFRIHRDIPFMRHALVFNVISLLTFFIAVGALAYRGLHLSIEFTGGTVLEMNYPTPPNLDAIRAKLGELGYSDPQVQTFGSSTDVLVRLPVSRTNKEAAATPAAPSSAPAAAQAGASSSADSSAGNSAANSAGNGATTSATNTAAESSGTTSNETFVSTRVGAALAELNPGAQLRRVEFVGPQVGQELAWSGLLALGMVVIGIVIYLSLRFEWKFAVSAIIANLHDVVIILGFFAIFHWEFSLSVLAAVLAVLGYSVNESVVIFDRIRETFHRQRLMTSSQIIDHAITSTISRTIITHGSTQVMVGSMLLFGGEVLHYFALALTVGILFGIYSSVFVAAAITMWLGIKREDLVKSAKPKGRQDDPNSGAVV